MSAAQALGIGPIENRTVLGQSLDVGTVVRLGSEETLANECVSADVHAGDNRVPPSELRVAVLPGPDAQQRRVRITSAKLIDEPVVTVELSLGCVNRMTRKVVLFVDPPLIQARLASIPADPVQAAEPVQAAPAVSPFVAAARQQADTAVRPAARRAPRAASRPRTRTVQLARADRPSAGTLNTPSARSAKAPRTVRLAAEPDAPTGPRLRLEAAARPATTAAAASAPAVSPLAATTPPLLANASAAGAAAVAPDAQAAGAADPRIEAMERELALLHADAIASRKTQSGIQAQLAQAQVERFANPLVYALAVLTAVLAAALLLLWLRRDRPATAQGHWWGSSLAATQLPASEDAVAVAPETAPALQLARPPIVVAQAVIPLLDPDPALDQRPDTGFAASMPAWNPGEPPRRELAVEELIDLEQQAEFFIVLGQDDAAIDLLMGHVRSTGGISPLPYLKLIEIYRRRNQRDAYDRIRERFNKRFNAFVPEWGADLSQGRGLDEYPEVLGRLQALWALPSQALRELDTMLFIRDPANHTFALPAYRELLLLFSVVRDLSEASKAAADVDLLLPIDAEAVDTPTSTIQMLSQQKVEAASALVDFDFSLDFQSTSSAAGGAAKGAPSNLDFTLSSEFSQLPGSVRKTADGG